MAVAWEDEGTEVDGAVVLAEVVGVDVPSVFGGQGVKGAAPPGGGFGGLA